MRLKKEYDLYSVGLAKTLGPATVRYDSVRRYLVFQPRDYKPCDSLHVDSQLHGSYGNRGGWSNGHDLFYRIRPT